MSSTRSRSDGHVQGHAAEAIEQVLPELPRLHPRRQIGLAGGHDARARCRPACPASARCAPARRRRNRPPRRTRDCRRARLDEQRRRARPRPARSAACATTKGSVRRSEKSWIARAISDLPVPDSPVISTGKIGVHHPRHQPVERLHRGRAAHQRQVVARLARLDLRRCGARRFWSSARAERFIRSGRSKGLGR